MLLFLKLGHHISSHCASANNRGPVAWRQKTLFRVVRPSVNTAWRGISDSRPILLLSGGISVTRNFVTRQLFTNIYWTLLHSCFYIRCTQLRFVQLSNKALIDWLTWNDIHHVSGDFGWKGFQGQRSVPRS